MSINETSAAPGVVDRDQQQARRLRNRLRYDAIQFAIIALAIALVGVLAYAVKEGLAAKGIKFSFAFLANTAGFDISEGKTLSFGEGILPVFEAFTSDRTNGAAFVTGMFNTAKVAVLAIVFSTILGTLFGVGRLSTNWVVRNLCFWIVEFVRNTPLLIQLVFWYFAVVLQFPPLASAAKWYGGVIISQQGLHFPSLSWAGDGSPISIALATATWLAFAGAVFDPVGKMRRACMIALALMIGVLLATGMLSVDYPVASRFQASGGTSLSPEMAALLLAIVVNSACYIAEIVRGAIDALPKGQWEAAGSLGLSRRDTISDIILPQVFRVVLPSFGNQYISLTKNTALGIAIGYPDLFNVYGTVANQTGHSLEGIVIVMASYLLLSWTISAAVSFADRRLNVVGAKR